jgi:hypothetical protein
MSKLHKTLAFVSSRKVITRTSVSVVALIAGYASYGHQKDVALRAHQPEHLALVLPFSVDGMIAAAAAAIAEDKAEGRKPRLWAVLGFWLGAAVSTAANVASVLVHWGLDTLAIAVSAWPPVAFLITIEILSRKGKVKVEPAIPTVVTPVVVAEPEPAISMADLESPDLPAAPVSPAIPGTPKAPAKARKPREAYGPRDGDEYSERHTRRQRTGK